MVIVIVRAVVLSVLFLGLPVFAIYVTLVQPLNSPVFTHTGGPVDTGFRPGHPVSGELDASKIVMN
jgi:hypothetical protein